MAKNSVVILLLSVSFLVGLGLVMLFSTGAFAHDAKGDAFHFLRQQGKWLVLGTIACTVAAFTDYHYLGKCWWVLFLVAAVLLALCYVPHVGMLLNGSRRWIHFGPVAFQPSEVGKLAAVVMLAWWFTKYEQQSSHFWRGFLAPLMIVSVLMILIVAEEDLGTTMLICCTSVAVMFIAGSNFFFMLLLGGGGFAAILLRASHMKDRLDRLTAFMDLEAHKEGAGLQQWWALIAFGSGGVDGVGLGESRTKMQYLPYAHTDFIFPIVGEELGLKITLLVVLAFLLVTLSGVMISMQARDRFGMLLGFGLVMTITIQACVNIGMTTALLPNKGMPLPFISSGGSNLCVCLFFVGVLINIYRQGAQQTELGASISTDRLVERSTPRV